MHDDQRADFFSIKLFLGGASKAAALGSDKARNARIGRWRNCGAASGISLLSYLLDLNACNIESTVSNPKQATELYGASRGKESGEIASPRTAWFPITDPGRWGATTKQLPNKNDAGHTSQQRFIPIQADQAESHGQTRVSDSTLGTSIRI